MREAVARRPEPLLFDFSGSAMVRSNQRVVGASEKTDGPRESLAAVPSAVAGDPDGLRSYQREAVRAALLELQRVQSTVIVLPTGAGKTRTACALGREWLAGRPLGRVLWLANRDFLIDDARGRLETAIGEYVSVEKAERRLASTRAVVGSVQTLKGERLKSIAPTSFDLIIFDECHHAAAAGARAIFDHFAGAKRLGITATLNRHDGVGAWNVWESIAYERTIEWAMAEGFFCPVLPVARFVDSIDLSKVKTTAGDLNLGGIEAEIASNAAAIAHLAWEDCGDRPTIVYTPGVASAHAVAATLNLLRPGCARAVDQKTPADERKATLRAFDAHELQFIVNCGIYLEGLDVPACRAIVIARPTKSEGLYIQMAGRGGRPEGWIGQLATAAKRRAAIAASGKPNFLLLDITGHAGRHSLCTAATLAGTATPAEKARAKKILDEEEGVDLETAVSRAKQELTREEDERIAKAARDALVKARREPFDPFRSAGIANRDAYNKLANRFPEPATEKQQWWLRTQGLPIDISKGEAMRLRSQAEKWEADGRANFSQRKKLSQRGLPNDISWRQAADLLHACQSASGGMPSAGVVASILSAGRAPGGEG